MEILIVGFFLLTWFVYNGQFYIRISRRLAGAGKKVLITIGVAVITLGLLYMVPTAVLTAWSWGGPVKGDYAFLFVYGTAWVAVLVVYILMDLLMMRWISPKVRYDS